MGPEPRAFDVNLVLFQNYLSVLEITPPPVNAAIEAE